MSPSREAIESILARLDALEEVVFASDVKSSTKAETRNVREYAGPTGGIRFLISEEKFFTTKRNLSEVRTELERHNYHYSRQAVHTALGSLSKLGGPLVTLTQANKKVYVERK